MSATLVVDSSTISPSLPPIHFNRRPKSTSVLPAAVNAADYEQKVVESAAALALNVAVPAQHQQQGQQQWRSCPQLVSRAEVEDVVVVAVEEETPSNASSSSTNSTTSYSSTTDFFLDDCPAVLQQVPDSFDLGLVPVRLCSLAASTSYLAIGSEGGALFLFNRRLGQGVRPLRTSYSEVVSQLQFCTGPDGRDQLAVGHRSGTLVLLALPSEQNTKLAQYIQEEAHRGSPLSALCWTPNGRTLFSADHSGMLLAVNVDFVQEQFQLGFVASEPARISALAIGKQHLAYACASIVKLVNWTSSSADYELIGQLDFGTATGEPSLDRILCLCFDREDRLKVLRADGKLFGLLAPPPSSSDEPNGCKYEAEELGQIWANLTTAQRRQWGAEELGEDKDNSEEGKGGGPEELMAMAPGGDTMALWKNRAAGGGGGGNLLLCRLWTNSFGLEVLALDERLEEPNLQVLSVSVTTSSSSSPAEIASDDELFVLTQPRRLLRLNRCSPAPSSLTTINPNTTANKSAMMPNVFGSLLAASKAVGELQRQGKRRAQGLLPDGTEQWLGRFNRELDVFLMGNPAAVETKNSEKHQQHRGLQQPGAELTPDAEEKEEESQKHQPKENEGDTGTLGDRLAAGFLMAEPERLAQGLQQWLGQIRQQSSSVLAQAAEFDHWSLAGVSQRGGDWGFIRRQRRDSSANLSLPTELSPSSLADDDREELLSLLGGEDQQQVGVGDDGTGRARREAEEAVRIRRKRIRRARPHHHKKRPSVIGGGGLRALAEERASRASALNVQQEREEEEAAAATIVLGMGKSLGKEEEEKEEPPVVGPLTDEREQQLMKVLNRMMGLGQEEEEEKKEEEEEAMKDEDNEVQKPAEEEEELQEERGGRIADEERMMMMKKTEEDVLQPLMMDGNDDDDQQVPVAEEFFGQENIREAEQQHIFNIGLEEEEEFGWNKEEKAEEEEREEEEEPLNGHRPIACLDLSELLLDGGGASPPPAPAIFPCSPMSEESICTSTVPSLRPPPALFQSMCRVPGTNAWHCLPTPFPVGHLGVSRHFLVICPRRQRSHRAHLLMTSQLLETAVAGRRSGGGDKTTAASWWTPLRRHAEAIVPNEPGTRLWRLCNGVGYSPATVPDPLGPSLTLSKCGDWYEMTSSNEGRLLQVALTSRHAWYLTSRGVFLQMYLPEQGIGIWYRVQEEDVEAQEERKTAQQQSPQFTQLAASDQAVWALNQLGAVAARTGLRHCPMGADWADMDGQPRQFVAIALFDRTGFGLDRQGALWFVHGVAPESPFGVGPWFKAGFPLQSATTTLGSPSLTSKSKLGPVSEWRLHVGSAGLFISVGTAAAFLLHCPGPLAGYCLEHVVPERLVTSDHFSLLAAGAFSGMTNDRLFACAPQSDELFAYSLRSRTFSQLPMNMNGGSGTPPVSLTAIPRWLFVLDRAGLVNGLAIGIGGFGFQSATSSINGQSQQQQWIRFGQPAKFASFAASTSSLWAIAQGSLTIWMCRFRSGEDGFDRLNWLEIEGPTAGKGKDKPDQIRVSPSGQSIWLLSSTSGLVWRRTELFDRNWRGRHWAQANDSIRIGDLAPGQTGVWALAKGSGQLHRLINSNKKCLEQQQHAATWLPLDFRLTALSLDSLEERLWAVDSEFRLVRLEMDIFPRSSVVDNNDAKAGGASATADEKTPPLRKARELPERTLSGSSVNSWGIL